MKLKEVEIQRLNKFCKKLIDGVEGDIKTWDTYSEIDRTLDYPTNQQILKEKINQVYPQNIRLTIDELKPKYDVLEKKENFEEKELFIEEEIKTKEEFDKSVKQIKKEDVGILKKKYEIPREYIKALVKGYIKSLILLGKMGIGKSFLVLQVLNKIEKANYSYHIGFSSPMALYKSLYENRGKDKIVVFDDTHGLISQPQALSILLSALYSVSGKRKIMWNSTTAKLKIPTEFIYEAKTILITNELPKTLASDLVNSRCLVHKFEFRWKELIQIMYSIAKTKHKKLSEKERIKIVDFIKENSDESTENFDLRVQNKIENLYLYDKKNWEKLSLPLLTKDNKLYLLKKCVEKENSIKIACRKWKELTGNSERNFYYLKQKIYK